MHLCPPWCGCVMFAERSVSELLQSCQSEHHIYGKQFVSQEDECWRLAFINTIFGTCWQCLLHVITFLTRQTTADIINNDWDQLTPSWRCFVPSDTLMASSGDYWHHVYSVWFLMTPPWPRRYLFTSCWRHPTLADTPSTTFDTYWHLHPQAIVRSTNGTIPPQTVCRID